MNVPTGATLSRAWYDASIADFLKADPDAIIGRLTQASNVAVEGTQTAAWRAQIEQLKPALTGLAGLVLFEFNIPRMGRRIDVVLLIGSVIFVVEFKVGESSVRARGRRPSVGLRTRPQELPRRQPSRRGGAHPSGN